MFAESAERDQVAQHLHDAVTRTGLTQSDFAAHLGTSASRLSTYLSGEVIPSAVLYLRALAVADALVHARELGLMTPDRAASAVNSALEAGDEDMAFRMVLQARDDLRTACQRTRTLLVAWARPARRINDRRYDVLYRVVVAHELRDDPPAWTTGARLDEEWVVTDPFRDEQTTRAQSPDWLARAGIFVAERALATA